MSANTPYPHLLAPLKLRHTTLNNRAIMGSMHTRLESLDNAVERQATFYAARARGDIGLIVTGGFSPNEAGVLEPDGPRLDDARQLAEHRHITDAVHEEGGKICLQILHAGRYGRGPDVVAPSPVRAPISPRTPRALSAAEITQTIADFAACAALAKEAGYDGVEVMGSEGYLINQFTAERTNKRNDDWGGPLVQRQRLPVEIVERTRAAVGDDFIIVYRISALDLVEGGATGAEIDELAQKIEAAGADILNTGIGWHEARVPTIAYMIPRAAWRFAPARLKKAVTIPVVASNRINMPDVAEGVLASGDADMVSMARPLLADPDFVRKAAAGRADTINTCIACNQACLDYIFSGRVATCLVNPRACRELEFASKPAVKARRVAVVGAGPGGLSCASEAAKRGHDVTLFEAADEVGGQIHLAKAVPGKSEFNELLRYFRGELSTHGVTVRTGTTARVDMLSTDNFDAVVIATGVTPRKLDIPGIAHASVVSYLDILTGRVHAGQRVAIIGSGGIGFDVAEYLTHSDDAGQSNGDVATFLETWAVDRNIATPGGLAGDPLGPRDAPRQVVMLQRKASKPGAGLGVSSGWILRNGLRKRGVEMLADVHYERIDDAGLHVTVSDKPRLIEADTIVVCAGQTSNRSLSDGLQGAGITAHLIGGAKEAVELDAMRAIEDGIRLALTL